MTNVAKSALTDSQIKALSPEDYKETFAALVWCADIDLLKWMAAYAEEWRGRACGDVVLEDDKIDTKFEQFKMLVEKSQNPSMLDRMAEYLHEYRSSRGLYHAIGHISTDEIRGYVAALLDTTETVSSGIIMKKVMTYSKGRANPAIVKAEIDRQIALKNKKGAHTDES